MCIRDSGKGQARVADRAAAIAAFERFGSGPAVLEKMRPLDCEISVVLARQRDGTIVSYPPAENAHEQGILDLSIVPARIAPALADAARKIAERIAGELDYVGVLTVEFFVSRDQLLVNELAPRPHNSGHYTLDAAVTLSLIHIFSSTDGPPASGCASGATTTSGLSRKGCCSTSISAGGRDRM